jgi:hypothetical protein
MGVVLELRLQQLLLQLLFGVEWTTSKGGLLRA